MATLTLSYNTGTVPVSRIVDAICAEYGYQANIPAPQNPGQTIPNPETKQAFAKRMIGTVIRNIVANQDLATARQAAEANVTPINLE